MTSFSPKATESFAEIGLTRYRNVYFAGRAAPLGVVTGAPVVAMLSGFFAFRLERALPVQTDTYRDLWRAPSTLREHREDG